MKEMKIQSDHWDEMDVSRLIDSIDSILQAFGSGSHSITISLKSEP